MASKLVLCALLLIATAASIHAESEENSALEARDLESDDETQARSLDEEKRQWSYGGSVRYRSGNHEFGGSVTHSNGQTSGGVSYRYNGKRMLEEAVKREARALVQDMEKEKRGDWSYGGSVRYRRGNHDFGGSVRHSNGRTSGGVDYRYNGKRLLEEAVLREARALVQERLAEEKRQFEAGGHISYRRGNHNFGAHISHGAGGTSGGLRYTYRFKKMLEEAARRQLRRELYQEEEE